MNNQINIIKKGRPKTIDLERIKNVAMINYWSDGPTNVSLNEICLKAKISKPGFYREFGGEDGLMHSVLLLYKNTLIKQILNILKLEKPFDETIDLLIEYVIDKRDKEHVKNGCLLAKFRQSRDKFCKKTQEQIDIILKERYLDFELWIKEAISKLSDSDYDKIALSVSKIPQNKLTLAQLNYQHLPYLFLYYYLQNQ